MLSSYDNNNLTLFFFDFLANYNIFRKTPRDLTLFSKKEER